MKRFLLVSVSMWALVGVCSVSHALTPTYLWSQRFGGTAADYGYSVAVDGSGNVLVTGSFQGTANFGGSDLVSADYDDIFLARYNSSGVHQWSKRFGSTLTDRGYSVAVDGSGNVLVTGVFQGTVNFGGSALTSAGDNDIFVARFNAAGVHQWSKSFGGAGDDHPACVAVDSPGNVLVTGSFLGTVNFGGSNLVSAGGYDVFVAKYNASGVHQWSKRFGSTSGDYGYSVAVDGVGNVLAVGTFYGTVNFEGTNLTSAGGSDIFVAKYNAAGAHQWSKRFGGPYVDNANSVAVDGPGNVVVAGSFEGNANFGGNNLTAIYRDIFVAKYNTAGVHQWSQSFKGSWYAEPNSVALDGAGNVLLTGFFQDTVDFGGGDLTSAGGYDIFVAKYNAAGVHQWSKRFGSTSTDFGNSVAVGRSVDVLVAGFFYDTVDFGGGNLTSAGFNDVFLAKFLPGPAEPVISAISDIGNDQGRQVKITFTGSGYDRVEAANPVDHYEAYRRNDPPPALSASPSGPSTLSTRQLLDLGWTQVGIINSHGTSDYSIDVPTIGDSTIAMGQYLSTFFVRAGTASPFTYYDSPTGSGYSLDNLAPGVPLNLIYDAGDLTWDESSIADFDFFTVYGANIDNLGAATLVNYSVAPSLDVTSSPYVYYFVTATDFSGNEGKPAKVNTLSGVGGVPKSYVLSVSNYPNPFNPRTTVTYTAPSPGEVKVRIYDARGAIVKTLFEGHRVAGAYSIEWDGRADNGGAVASGLYFARIEHASGTRSKKMVLLK